MEEQRNQTVGQIVSDLRQKTPDTLNPIEIMEEKLTDYDEQLALTVEDGKRIYPQSFFVEVIFKSEPMYREVTRNMFIHRWTCSTPNYDQAMYRYDHISDTIEFLWVIPDRETCFMFIQNALLIPAEQKELLKFIIEFADGTLLQLCKDLNGEQVDSAHLDKKIITFT